MAKKDHTSGIVGVNDKHSAHQSEALNTALHGFFDLRALAFAAIALVDTDGAPEEVIRVLTQLAGRATDLANLADTAALIPARQG